MKVMSLFTPRSVSPGHHSGADPPSQRGRPGRSRRPGGHDGGGGDGGREPHPRLDRPDRTGQTPLISVRLASSQYKGFIYTL